MNITRSTINGIVSSQINSTMQSHMRDYSNLSPIYSESREEERKRKEREKYLYEKGKLYNQYFRNIIYYLLEQITYEELEIRNEPLTEDAKNYLRCENEEIISSTEFTEAIEKKQQLKKEIGYLSFSANREYKGYSIYYIPSIDNESTNIIRMDIIESFHPHSFDVTERLTINGSIDFYEDGTINVGTFTEYEKRIQRDDEGKFIRDGKGQFDFKYLEKEHEITLDKTRIKKENLVEVGNIISDLLNSLNETIDKKR